MILFLSYTPLSLFLHSHSLLKYPALKFSCSISISLSIVSISHSELSMASTLHDAFAVSVHRGNPNKSISRMKGIEQILAYEHSISSS